MDPDYADQAIAEFLTEPLRAIPPGIGFDAGLVLREAVAARRRRLLRDWSLLALTVLFFVTSGIGWALAWLVVGLLVSLVGWRRADSDTTTADFTGTGGRVRRRLIVRICKAVLSYGSGAIVLLGIALLGAVVAAALAASAGELDLSGLSPQPTPPGVSQVLFGLLILAVLAADRFALSSLLTRSFRRGTFSSHPTLTEWQGERWLRTLGHPRHQVDFERIDNADLAGNLVVYRGVEPFVGAGVTRNPISFAIPLEPAIDDDLGPGVQPFTMTELYDHVSRQLLALRDSHSLSPSGRLAGLAEYEQVIVPADELLVNFGDPMSTLVLPSLDQPPEQSIAPEPLSRLTENSLEWMRYYRCYRLEAWDRDVTLSCYLHFGAGERMLYVEWIPCLLLPVDRRFRQVDQVPIAPLRPLRDGVLDLIRLPYTLPIRTVRLFRRIRSTSQAAGTVQADRYGAWSSLRELGAGASMNNYFQTTDVDRYLKVLQTRMTRAIGEFLDARGIASTEFLAQAAQVVHNETYIDKVVGNVATGGVHGDRR
ncbi:MAG TPA: hypothetical protein VGL80_02895 [Pseudonocardiaceae bacterium]|jgi:hypothetical protein